MSPGDRRSVGVWAAATILCLGILFWGPSPLLNLAAAGPLVLYLPGWAFLRALGTEPEGWVECNLLRVMLSLAIVVILGLLLHLADSITRPGWLAALGVTMAAACVASLASGGRAAVGLSEAGQARARWTAYRPVDVSMLALAIGLAAGAVALSVTLTLHEHEFRYTQLWIVPKQDAPDTVVIGLRNAEADEESYAIELLVDRHLVQSWSEVWLKPGETWRTTFRWTGFGEYPRPVPPLRELLTSQEAPKATIAERVGLGAAPRVEALVYRSNNRSVVYRHVWSAPQCVADETPHGRPPCEF
jgi:uncharacterized membrane protein